MTLLAWSFAHSLWFSSEASWDRTSFVMLALFASLALIFFFLAIISGKPHLWIKVSPRKVLTIALTLIFGFIMWMAASFYLSYYISRQINLARTAETSAEIISESKYVSGSKNQTTTTYTVKYTYTVNDRLYEAVSHFYKPLKQGGKPKACYNPANPQSSQIRDADYQCGQDSSD